MVFSLFNYVYQYAKLLNVYSVSLLDNLGAFFAFKILILKLALSNILVFNANLALTYLKDREKSTWTPTFA